MAHRFSVHLRRDSGVNRGIYAANREITETCYILESHGPTVLSLLCSDHIAFMREHNTLSSRPVTAHAKLSRKTPDISSTSQAILSTLSRAEPPLARSSWHDGFCQGLRDHQPD